ncbi:MAG TPA: LysM peptidoglycan-binding domain-containing protein [Chthoniobacterales bacterium]|nr:LysM peptidoglycan-binding domain-containing protein [Chthoniobacterales bacterium]
MRPSKILILAAVALLVFGSAGFFAYKLFLKPTHFSFFGKKEPVPVALPTPDPGTTPFDAAVALQKSGKLSEAHDALVKWLEAYPNSPKITEARTLLGNINSELLTSPSPSNEKVSYIVVKGDSLARIASRQKSNAELIQHVNNLPNINLQIGQELFIPQLKMSIEIDRSGNLLILRDHDQFFKSYTLLSTPPYTGQQKAPTETIVIDKIAMINNKRVAFGDKKYPESERTILLRSNGNIVALPEETASTAPSSGPNNVTTATNSTSAPSTTMPPGFVLSLSDMKEVFPLINKDTPVSIH